MRSATSLFLMIWVALGLLLEPAFAAEDPRDRNYPETEPDEKPRVEAVRIDTPIKIDGRLDEAAWLEAPAAGPFYQSESANIGQIMTELTLFRVLYDDENLYIGVWCYDSEPDKIVARIMERDNSSMQSDDYLYMAVDSFHDNRNGYIFIVNPNGARRDSLVTNNIYINSDWNGVWQCRASIDDEGWKVEVALPLKTMSFDPGTDVWGFNMARTIARKNERGRWTGGDPAVKTYQVAEAGDITNLIDLKQGIGLELSPYVVGRYRDRSGSSTTGDFGGDLRYRFTPNLSGTVSYNTDFAETEVDQRQLNFTRFPLFFPEKRAFFLEDSGVYEYGGLTGGSSSRSRGLRTPLLPYYTRRIGLSKQGEVVPILVAGKVAGRAGKYSLGATDVVLESHDDIGTKNVFSGRVSREIWEQSSVGVISTAGDPNSDDDNALFGPDFGYRTSTFLGDKMLEANAFALGTYTDNGETETDYSYGVTVNYPNDLVEAKVQIIEIGEEFNPALGFVRRKEVRGYYAYSSFNPRPASSRWVRQYHTTYSSEHFTDLDNSLDTAQHWFTPLWIETEQGASTWISLSAVHDSPDEDFELLENVLVPEGDYWWYRGSTGFRTARQYKVSVSPRVELGEFYDGHRTEYSLGMAYYPSKHVGLTADYSFNEVNLPDGDFDTHLASGRMNWNFTPDLVWSHLVQYDSISDSVGYNSRIQWEYLPGSRMFLVLNQNFFSEDLQFKLEDTEVALKAGAIFRF